MSDIHSERQSPSGVLPPQVMPPGVLAGAWQPAVLIGALTLVLGLVVTFHPTGSLNLIAVLLGVLTISPASST